MAFATLVELIHTGKALSPIRIRKIFRQIGLPENVAPSVAVSPGKALMFWVAKLLSVRALVDQDSQELIMETYGEWIEIYGDKLQFDWNAEAKGFSTDMIPVVILSIADGQHVALSNASNFLDLKTGQTTDTIPSGMPLEFIGFNLARLFTMEARRIGEKRKSM